MICWTDDWKGGCWNESLVSEDLKGAAYSVSW